jgi:FkbM family methyltransferase
MFSKLVNKIRKNFKAFFPICELEGVKVYGYGKYLTPVISESIYNNQYEKAELQMLKQYLSKEDIVMEIGSGIGFLSAYCSKLIGSHKVFSYEANPNLQEIIQTTYRINNVNPTFYSCLVGEEVEEKTFYITKDFWSSSFIKPSNDEIVKTITVLAKSFNQEVERVKPSLLIVDVEGGEYELLQSARLDHIQKIIIELHNSLIGRDKIDSIKHKLVNSGFQIIQVVPNCDDEILYLGRLGT